VYYYYRETIPLKEGRHHEPTDCEPPSFLPYIELVNFLVTDILSGKPHNDNDVIILPFIRVVIIIMQTNKLSMEHDSINPIFHITPMMTLHSLYTVDSELLPLCLAWSSSVLILQCKCAVSLQND